MRYLSPGMEHARDLQDGRVQILPFRVMEKRVLHLLAAQKVGVVQEIARWAHGVQGVDERRGADNDGGLAVWQPQHAEQALCS